MLIEANIIMLIEVNKIVLRLTQPVFSICIYCILNRTCLLYASILYGKQLRFFLIELRPSNAYKRQ